MTKVLEIKPESVVLDDQRLLPPRVVEVVPGPHAKNDTSFPILHVRDVQLNEAEQNELCILILRRSTCSNQCMYNIARAGELLAPIESAESCKRKIPSLSVKMLQTRTR